MTPEELEHGLKALNEAMWKLSGRANAVEILAVSTFAMVASEMKRRDAKARLLASFEAMRKATEGDRFDQATPHGRRQAAETRRELDDLLSHISENLAKLGL